VYYLKFKVCLILNFKKLRCAIHMHGSSSMRIVEELPLK
jgi:hypothetical protein